ncbi:hypothetical protein VNO77_31705 [Canavalia gladiata]|uniref:Uncharacterized protein n=1 Tax=Canavalia gladiata TaxID=3824 RepID=A0AAN9KT10_CANGL
MDVEAVQSRGGKKKKGSKVEDAAGGLEGQSVGHAPTHVGSSFGTAMSTVGPADLHSIAAKQGVRPAEVPSGAGEQGVGPADVPSGAGDQGVGPPDDNMLKCEIASLDKHTGAFLVGMDYHKDLAAFILQVLFIYNSGQPNSTKRKHENVPFHSGTK